jgi:hypothetical protein
LLRSGSFPVNEEEIDQIMAHHLLKTGRSHKQQLPKTLIIPKEQAADALCREAERQKITVVRVPEKELLIFTREARDSFKERVGTGDS